MLNQVPGVRESAVIGTDRVHAVVVLEDGADAEAIVRRANAQLEDHQKIRSISVWPGTRLPRTEGTQKIKHAEIQRWVASGGPAPAVPGGGELIELVWKYAPDRTITADTSLDELGLSSLDRVELMMDLEQRFDTSIDESLLTSALNGCCLSTDQHASQHSAISGLEPVLVGPSGSPGSASHNVAATESDDRACSNFGSGAPGFFAGPRDFRIESSESPGHALHPGCITRAISLPRGCGDVEGVLRRPLFPGTSYPDRMAAE
jgi:hypothetical protein